MLSTILHLIHKKSCLNHAQWKGNSLVCQKCGNVLALRYLYEDEVKVYVYYDFSEFTAPILAREDIKNIAVEGDALGVVHCTRFDEILHHFE